MTYLKSKTSSGRIFIGDEGNMIFKEFAPLYTDKGYQVIPLAGKIPKVFKWQNYCSTPVDEFTFVEWIEKFPDANIGMPLGPASGVLAWDVDIHSTALGTALYEFIKDLLPYSRIERRGKKYYARLFAYNGELPDKIQLGTEFLTDNGKPVIENGCQKKIVHAIELLSQSRQVALPPSLHPDTLLPYVWANEPLYDIEKEYLPPFPIECISKIRERIQLFPGQRFCESTDHGASEAAGRNDKLTDVAWAMVSRAEPIEKMIVELLKADERNSPPLFSDPAEKQMRGKTKEQNAERFINSIIKSWSKHNGKEYEPYTETLNLHREECEFGTDNYRFNSLYNLLKDGIPEPTWLWEGIIPEVGLCIPAGPPKCGKSTLIRQLVTAMSDGSTVFGKKVAQGAVLYLAFEEGPQNVLRQFQKMGAESARNIYLHSGFPTDPNLNQLANIIAEKNVKLIVVDTLINILQTDKLNDYGVVYPILNKLIAFCRSSKVCIMGIHHANKSGEGSAAIMGSTAFRAACETMIIMTHDEETEERTIATLQRTGESLPTTLLDYDPDTNLLELDLTPKKAENLEIDTKVLDVIRLSGPISQKGIKGKSGESQVRISRSLVRLISSLKVRRKGSGSSKDQYLYEINQFAR